MVEERVHRRLAAILAADVVGYGRLMGADEAGTLARLKAIRTELIDPELAEHGGRIVKEMGDGLLVAFESVVDAVCFAVDLQQAMLGRNADHERPVQYRVGINIGDVIVDGDDIHGDGVNLAVRLEALAEPGGICLSGDAVRQVRGKLALEFEDLGEREVKNIAEPVHLHALSVGAGIPRATMGRENRPPVSDKPSIAVLPFTNMSGDPEQEYFADGIAEDIITALSKYRWFLVIARNSSFAFKGGAHDLKSVARALGVRYVLEGSVRRAGRRLRITAQLVDAPAGFQVWTERYDRELDDIFAVQDEITASIVSAVAPEFLSAEVLRARRKDVRSLDAWDCVMRASWHQARISQRDFAEAHRLLANAIGLDPLNVGAHCLEAFTHLAEVQFGWTPSPGDSLKEAARAARTAVALDARDALAHTAMGMVDLMSRRYQDAIPRLERAIGLNANLASAQGALGQAHALAGDYEAAVDQIETAIRLSPEDPFKVYWFGHLGLGAYAAGRFQEAADWGARAVSQNPDFPGGHRLLAASLAQLGRLEEARAELGELLRQMPGMTAADVRWQVPFKRRDDIDRYIEGLHKAGLPR